MAMRSLPERLAASRRWDAARRPEPVAPPPPVKPRFGWRSVLLILALAGTGAFGILTLRPLAESWLVQQWRNQLVAESANEDVAALMASAAEQQDWGLRLLVAATSSANEEAQQASVRQLQALLQRWRQEPGIDHSAQVQLLVHFLVAERGRYSPEQLTQLLPLVEHLMAWPVLPETTGFSTYLADAEELSRTLATVVIAPPEPDGIWPTQPLPSRSKPAAEIAQRPAAPPALSLTPDENLAPLPLPLPAPDSQPEPTEPAAVPIPTTPSVETANPPFMLELLPQQPGMIRKLPESTDNAAKLPEQVLAIPAAISVESERKWRQWTDWQVMRTLVRSPEQAETELRLRGYKDHDLALARRATSAEPEERLKLVEELPRMRGVDPRLWLQQLASDPERKVRDAATAILATASGRVLK